MKRLILMLTAAFMLPVYARSEANQIWQIVSEEGQVISEICYEPHEGDVYIATDNMQYEIFATEGNQALVKSNGHIELPSVDWLASDSALPVSATENRIALYCTHSDESFEPSDGYYSTTQRGSIYEVAQQLADELAYKGIEAIAADMLHHPHDAGAYRRSRQTAVQLLKKNLPDCLIDIHRDGIPDPASYAVQIGGEEVSKIRLLVGRGNQNAEVNKEFALMIKAVADRVYPGLIKDIYMGKGTFNQDLLPRSILFECGTYTLKKEHVLASMPLIADVLNRALYGGIIGSAGRTKSDVGNTPKESGGITQGEADVPIVESAKGIGSGFGFIGIMLLIGIVGFALLSAGSWKNGFHKAGRNLSEMTGGLIGKLPEDNEEHSHS